MKAKKEIYEEFMDFCHDHRDKCKGCKDCIYEKTEIGCGMAFCYDKCLEEMKKKEL